MPTEETLIATRQTKHQEANGKTYPLAEKGMPIASVLYDFERFGDIIKTTVDPTEPVSIDATIHGRLIAFRKSGALTFMKVTDTTGNIQLIAARMHLSNYDELRLLDLGDIVEIHGPLAWSKTKERSILVQSWKLLTKAHRPPPEKFIGIQDTELKYRKRYLDLMSSEESRARFTVRSYVLRAIRKTMDERQFLEVETSTLSTIASGANAKPFTTHHNALDTELRLRIAPELNLKRLLVGGMDRVYEIGRAYRNEGIDTRHNPEFTIMEFYEAYGKFEDLIIITKDLLREIDFLLEKQLPKNVLPYYQQWQANRPFSLSRFAEVSMHNAVMHACGKAGLSLTVGGCDLFCPGCVADDIFLVNIENSNTSRFSQIDIKGLFHAISEAGSTGEKWAIMFEHVAEPFLAEDYRTEDGLHSCPVFITQYPKDICPLARANDRHASECDRFELFVEGRELANAFQELNDPQEQAARFQEQLESNNKDPMAYDADYVEALEHGMPPAIGFGMGIDRLVMLLTGTTSIKDVILFPTLRPANG